MSTEGRGIILFALVAVLAAWAATAPVVNLPVDNHLPPIKRADSLPQPAATPGTSMASPLYVRARCDQGCGVSEDRRSVFDRLLSDPVALFTALLFGCTGLLGWATVQLWRTTAKTLDHAKESSERQLRAYVGISSRLLQLNKDGQWWCTIGIKNHGQTPALKVKITWQLWIGNYPNYEKDLSLGEKP